MTADVIDIRTGQLLPGFKEDESIEGCCRRSARDCMTIPDTRTPEMAMLAAYLSKKLQDAILKLDFLERRVLCMRFGINVDAEMEWEQIAKNTGVSVERARLLFRKAFKKLRKGFLERSSFDEDDHRLFDESVGKNWGIR